MLIVIRFILILLWFKCLLSFWSVMLGNRKERNMCAWSVVKGGYRLMTARFSSIFRSYGGLNCLAVRFSFGFIKVSKSSTKSTASFTTPLKNILFLTKSYNNNHILPTYHLSWILVHKYHYSISLVTINTLWFYRT